MTALTKMNDKNSGCPAKKIIVVDDDTRAAEMSRACLREAGYSVYTVGTRERAVALLSRTHCELALIDAALPDGSGTEVFAAMRRIEPNLAAVLLSAHPDATLIVEAMNRGFNGVVEKPLDTGKLVKVVRETLDLARSRENNTRLKTLGPLYRLGEKFLSATSTEQVYDELVDAVFREIRVPSISLMMFDEASGQLKIVASRGMSRELVDNISLRPGEQIAGWVYQEGKPVILNKPTQHHSPFSQLLTRDGISASISFPLVSREKVIGVINISQVDPEIEYSQADIEMLSIITGQAIMALENVVSRAERENAIRIKALLEQYVAPEVAELLMASKQSLMEVGSVKNITVLFADIRNFTLLVQHLPPEKLRIFLNAFFNIFSNVVFSWQGTLDKFMGDAVLAIFGAPIAIDKASHAAVSAACQILDEFELLRKQWLATSALFNNIGLGIGMSKGEMFLGNVGSTRRLDFTVIGTDVNIAQRLATEALSGQILITGAMHDDIDAGFPFKREKARMLKGIEKEMELYSLVPPKKKKGGKTVLRPC
jgi:adenylate cyclase